MREYQSCDDDERSGKGGNTVERGTSEAGWYHGEFGSRELNLPLNGERLA